MSRVITFMNQKGGVAKTTSAVTMAYCLEELGYSVLFLDLDAQANASVQLLTTYRYEDVLDKNIVTLVEGSTTFDETVQPCSDRIDVIPSTLYLSIAEIEWQNKISREYLLKKTFQPVSDRYDFIIIDTPPHLQLLALNAIVFSDDIIVPYNADTFSLAGIKMVHDAILPVAEGGLNDGICISGLLLTRYEQTRMNSFIIDNIEMLARDYGVRRLFKTYIRKTTKVPESISQEAGLLEFAPDCTAAEDYREFTREYLEMIGYKNTKEG